MEHNMILSASGWRKVFAVSGNQNDADFEIGKNNTALCVLAAEAFALYVKNQSKKRNPLIAVGTDTRPTGKTMAQAIVRTLIYYNIKVQYLGISAAPEIMAYSKKTDGFLYISASHNPIGHNGLKFGLGDGGVLEGGQAKILADSFREKCAAENAQSHAEEILNAVSEKYFYKLLRKSEKFKAKALGVYSSFMKEIVTGSPKEKNQKLIFDLIKTSLEKNPVALVCDMNGSARCKSIDSNFFTQANLEFIPFNDTPGNIVHEIIPEPENLVYCAEKINMLQSKGKKDAVLGYMPDCDGDRGNIVYWSRKNNKAQIIPAQEIFALSVLSQLTFECWKNNGKVKNLAVAVNCPTSMRIDEICSKLDAQVFRSEVGEANVVNLGKEKRSLNFKVPVLGEGSNGGNITFPSAVRDPVASVFAIIKLLTLRDVLTKKGQLKKGLFHIWCEKCGVPYSQDFTLDDIIATLPEYVTTGVSEKRAVLKVKTSDKGKLKLRFEKIFLQEYRERKDELEQKYGICSWECCTTNGTKEIKNASDWNNGNGGLKVIFYGKDKTPQAFMWMRPSGTENVFRIMCDVKGNRPQMEESLLQWETSMITKADAL
ncbi:MAG: phosphoglucomutase [Spirochaetia bacterium]|nr:phosphoglucomutase [Spirochaetia bacterium]